MTEQHRVLLIGHGVISRRYMEAFGRISNTAIVGVVGRDQERATAYAEQHGIAYADTDLRRAVEATNATIAVICTPNGIHDQAVIEAAGLGLHCLCEKPLHIRPERQDEMVQACHDNGVKLGVSFMRRFTDHIRYVKELVDQGALGKLKVVDAVLKHYRAPEYYESWHGTWHMDGGGPFIQQASHLVDLALWLGGGWREVIDARTFQAVHDIETEDHGYALVAYESGAIGMWQASTACKGLNSEYVAISGTRGSIVLDFDGIQQFAVEGISMPEFSEDGAAVETLFYRLAEDFIQSIEQDREPFISGKSAQAAVEVVDTIYRTAGQPVRLA